MTARRGGRVLSAMGDPTDPDDREEAWRLYESCRFAMQVWAMTPDAHRRGARTLQRIRAYYPTVWRLERRWGFRQQDALLP